MEIHDKPVHENRPLRRNAAERPIDFTRPLREGLRAFREMQAEGDRAEAEAAGKAREAASSREERVEALRRAIADGALNSSERIDRAAREMLGG